MFVSPSTGRFHIQARITTKPRKRSEFDGGTVYFQAKEVATGDTLLVETTDYIGLDSTGKGQLVDLNGTVTSTEGRKQKVLVDYLTVRELAA
jgi:hypothetical protein